jgi:hypothetical protein
VPTPIVGVVVAARPITFFDGVGNNPERVDVIWRVLTRWGVSLFAVLRYVVIALRDFVPRAVALFVVVARVFVVVRICCKFADVRPSPLAMPMNIKHDKNKKRNPCLVILT